MRRIHVESLLGKGSKFSFSISLPAGDSIHDSHEEEPVLPEGYWRVLLVDDNANNRTVVSGYLNQLGIHVSVACDGHEAVNYLKDHCDLVLMDCQMPTLDGYEATKQIHEIEGLESLPIVALTAHAMAGARERCIDAGMCDYLTKPFLPEDLLAVLARNLGSAETEDYRESA